MGEKQLRDGKRGSDGMGAWLGFVLKAVEILSMASSPLGQDVRTQSAANISAMMLSRGPAPFGNSGHTVSRQAPSFPCWDLDGRWRIAAGVLIWLPESSCSRSEKQKDEDKPRGS